MKATDYLFDAAKYAIPGVCAVYGKDSFLKFHAIRAIRDQVLTDGEAEFSLSRFEGKNANIEHVLSDVSTQAMFGGSRRLVWIEDADSFLSVPCEDRTLKNKQYRDLLEEYADKPSKSGVLLLELDSFPSNTRLYKKLEQVGFLVDCTPPLDRDVSKWLVRWAGYHHQTTCKSDAAALLVDLIGPELGLLDQELARLSLYVPPKGAITAEIVQNNVGSMRTRKLYEMLNLALSGKAADAIRELDKLLLLDKEANPNGILGYIAKSSLPRFAAATQLFLEAERSGRPISPAVALEAAGFERARRDQFTQSEQQLKAIGRHRGKKLPQWLLQADLDMKGASRCSPRLILETLLIRIADPRLK